MGKEVRIKWFVIHVKVQVSRKTPCLKEKLFVKLVMDMVFRLNSHVENVMGLDLPKLNNSINFKSQDSVWITSLFKFSIWATNQITYN